MRKGCGKIHQSINTFTDDKRKLAQHPPGGMKSNSYPYSKYQVISSSVLQVKLIETPRDNEVANTAKEVAETAEISTTNRGAGMGGKRKWGEEQAGRSREDSTSLYAELGLYGSDTESDEEMPSVARPNPDDVAESLPLPTPGVLAGPNLEHSDVEITNPTSQPQPEHMDEGFMATAYHDVQEI
ncbi:hypothetical protein Tco_0307414 [Tanacetum coccineum]